MTLGSEPIATRAFSGLAYASGCFMGLSLRSWVQCLVTGIGAGVAAAWIVRSGLAAADWFGLLSGTLAILALAGLIWHEGRLRRLFRAFGQEAMTTRSFVRAAQSPAKRRLAEIGWLGCAGLLAVVAVFVWVVPAVSATVLVITPVLAVLLLALHAMLTDQTKPDLVIERIVNRAVQTTVLTYVPDEDRLAAAWSAAQRLEVLRVATTAQPHINPAANGVLRAMDSVDAPRPMLIVTGPSVLADLALRLRASSSAAQRALPFGLLALALQLWVPDGLIPLLPAPGLVLDMVVDRVNPPALEPKPETPVTDSPAQPKPNDPLNPQGQNSPKDKATPKDGQNQTGSDSAQQAPGDQGQSGSDASSKAPGDQGQSGADRSGKAPGDQGQSGSDGSGKAPGDQGQSGSDGSGKAPGDQGQSGSDGSGKAPGDQGQSGSDGFGKAPGDQGQSGADGSGQALGDQGQSGSDGSGQAPGNQGQSGQKGQSGQGQSGPETNDRPRSGSGQSADQDDAGQAGVGEGGASPADKGQTVAASPQGTGNSGLVPQGAGAGQDNKSETGVAMPQPGDSSPTDGPKVGVMDPTAKGGEPVVVQAVTGGSEVEGAQQITAGSQQAQFADPGQSAGLPEVALRADMPLPDGLPPGPAPKQGLAAWITEFLH